MTTVHGASLAVVAPGLHTTIQDRGRFGHQDVGMPVSGPLDDVGLRLANALVGNPPGMAALEILMQGPTLEVAAESVRVALAGSGAGIEVLGEEARVVPSWRSITLRRGQSFRIRALADSACAYLAVEGGFAIEPCLGSLSTYVRGGIGGLHGGALRPGDNLPLRFDAATERDEVMLPKTPDLAPNRTIRVVLGPQQDYFTDAAVDTLLSSDYRVSQNADRMGFRLDGPILAHRDGYNIVSDGIATGAIQVPGSGQPILLLADHGTAGGYPKIATVISADLPVIGRRRPGDGIRFAAVTVAEAEAIRQQEEAALQTLIRRLRPVSEDAGIDLAALYSQNLISGVVSGAE
ncbi:biotin-dependent carboxyltransferase family protein [Rhodospirillaceae bacterium SYSU D60014]|uniref:5-oxoprolinase subunit C family protein n=1 Tax=Virgifigura deserti TaxID=2268457 RepID=UPI000E661CF5